MTGLVADGFEEAVKHSLEALAETSSWVIAVTLVAGALAASLLTHCLGGRSSSTTDVYVEQFHERAPPVEPKHAVGRLTFPALVAMATTVLVVGRRSVSPARQ